MLFREGRGTVKRPAYWAFVLALLVACGGATQPAALPTANPAPTQTRAAELSQLATLTVPTATPAITPTTTPTAAPTVTPALTSTLVPAHTPIPTLPPPPATSAASAQLDTLLPLDAPNPTLPGFRMDRTARYSLRLLGSEASPESATPEPPMNGCDSRYFVLRFRTVGNQNVAVFVGGPANVRPIPGTTPPPARQVGVTSAGVIALGGCSAALFQATGAGTIVDIAAEYTTYLATPFALGTSAPPSTSIPTATTRPLMPTLTPTRLPSPTPRPQPTATAVVSVRQIGAPRWWVVPFQPGYGNTEEGFLYFGVTVENSTDRTVSVGVSFTSYAADGTQATGCYAPGGDGPGVTETIAPRETALISCKRSIVPRTTAGLQVTARLWDTTLLPALSPAYDVTQASFTKGEVGRGGSSPMETLFTASALVRARGGQDTTARLIFRFYNDQRVQVATCASNDERIEPEVARRVSCALPVSVDTVRPQPVTVRADPVAR